MSSERWSDRELRDFVVRAPRLFWSDSEVADVERRAFRAQLIAHVAPGVQARVLAEVGALTSPEGLAVVGTDLLEEFGGSRKREWLLVCTEPWRYLEEWLAESVVTTYRATAGRARRDAKVLDGIAAASTRSALERGESE